MSATVTWVEKKGDKAAILVMSDDTRVWTPDKALADTLVGKEIPPDWTIKQGQYGPQALPPKPKGGFGGPAAYRNTKEGFHEEQDFMNLRTAVMQATVEGVFIKDTANEIYAWLRQASGVAVATVSDNGEAQTSPSTSGGVEPDGEAGSTSSAAPCAHKMTSPLKPDGRPFNGNFVRCLDCGYVLEATDA
jgi:hypothetical protein